MPKKLHITKIKDHFKKRIIFDGLRKVTNTILMDRGGFYVQNDHRLDRPGRHHVANRGIHDISTWSKPKRGIR